MRGNSGSNGGSTTIGDQWIVAKVNDAKLPTVLPNLHKFGADNHVQSKADVFE